MTEKSLNIFRPIVESGFQWALVPQNSPFELYDTLRDLPLRRPGDPWEPLPMEVVSPIDGEIARRATLPWNSRHFLVLQDEAVDVVGALLAPHGELLPVIGPNTRLELFNAPRVPSALIEDRSDLQRDPPPSPYVKLIHGVFDIGAVQDRQAFTAAIGRRHELCLREDLVRAIEATGQTSGTRFERIGTLAYRDGSVPQT